MILTHDEILRLIEAGEIEIDPLTVDLIGPGSIDLRLSDQFRIFKQIAGPVRISEDVDVQELTELVVVDEEFVLPPGETVLGLTLERIKLPGYLCGWLEGRSRFARVGLLIHMTAAFIQPGINNRQVLEISNLAPFPLALQVGSPICQFVFQRTEGQAVYQGRHMNQDRL